MPYAIEAVEVDGVRLSILSMGRTRFRFFACELHYHHCPACYEAHPCLYDCDYEPDLDEHDGRRFGATSDAVRCDHDEETPIMQNVKIDDVVWFQPSGGSGEPVPARVTAVHRQEVPQAGSIDITGVEGGDLAYATCIGPSQILGRVVDPKDVCSSEVVVGSLVKLTDGSISWGGNVGRRWFARKIEMATAGRWDFYRFVPDMPWVMGRFVVLPVECGAKVRVVGVPIVAPA